MIGGDDLRQSEGPEPQQTAMTASARQVIPQLTGCVIAPMQVLCHEQQRTILRVTVQQLTHFSQHARLACTDELGPQCIAFGCAAKPWQAQEPAWSNRTHEVGQRQVPPAERGERFEHGKIGFARATLFDAVSVSAMTLADFADEALDERGFSDAGLAGDPNDPSFAGPPSLPRRAQAGEVLRSADQWRRG